MIDKVNTISPKTVKELRERTGAGMMNCKKALEEKNGNIEEAIVFLRQKGLASADKKANRDVNEGIIDAYIHTGSRIGVLLELNCETDFVARRQEFKDLAKNIAMQIAASPLIKYTSYESISTEIIEKEKEIERKKEDLQSKPLEIREKIVSGRVEKTLNSQVLLSQPFIKDSSLTVEDLVKQNISLLGENIRISRFIRYNLSD